MFKSKREKEAIENYRKHSSIALECMDLFIKEVEALLREDWDEIERIEGIIYEKEREGDALRRKNEYLFSEGLLFPSDRATFINLSEQIDKVIDKIQQVSRIISLRKPSKDAIDFLATSKVMEYLQITKKSVDSMEQCPVCGEPMKKIENMTLDGRKITTGFRCTFCAYWTGKLLRVPTRYIFKMD